MENKNNNQGGFGNGFVLGLLVGVVATLFITTKRGREIFKELTEKGIDRFSDFEDKLQEKTRDLRDVYDELDEEEDSVPESRKVVQPESDQDRIERKLEPSHEVRYIAEREEHEHKREHAKLNESSHKPSGVRRFFKKKS